MFLLKQRDGSTQKAKRKFSLLKYGTCQNHEWPRVTIVVSVLCALASSLEAQPLHASRADLGAGTQGAGLTTEQRKSSS